MNFPIAAVFWGALESCQKHQRRQIMDPVNYGVPKGFPNHVDVFFCIMPLDHFCQFIVTHFGAQFLGEVEALPHPLFLPTIDYGTHWTMCFYILHQWSTILCSIAKSGCIGICDTSSSKVDELCRSKCKGWDRASWKNVCDGLGPSNGDRSGIHLGGTEWLCYEEWRPFAR